MVISIFGLGYVGCISLACLADMGFNVIGVDIVEEKVNLINSGKSTVVEEQVEELIEKNRNKIEATVNTELAFSRSDVSFICVPTPNENNGALDLSYLRNVISQIAQSIKLSQKFHTVVIRSTVPPGTNREMCSLIEQISSKKSGVDFGVVSNPEFLREGSAVKDFFNPPYTLIASESELALAALKQIYSHLNAEIIVSKLEVAEILKYVNNTFHALKISFANEIGNICNSLKIDSHELMDIFCKDEKLNISSAYLRPGFAYGGSCLPKDLSALCELSRRNYLRTPVIDSVSVSNGFQVSRAIKIVEQFKKRTIGFLGISFKTGTDDLRNSPLLDIVEYCLGKGYNVLVYDNNINLSLISGKNKEYLNSKLPHIQKLLSDSLLTVIQSSEILVIGNKNVEFEEIKLSQNKSILDLIRVPELENIPGYHGVNW